MEVDSEDFAFGQTEEWNAQGPGARHIALIGGSLDPWDPGPPVGMDPGVGHGVEIGGSCRDVGVEA